MLHHVAATSAHQLLTPPEVRAANMTSAQRVSDMRVARRVLLAEGFETVYFTHHVDPWTTHYTRELLSLERVPPARDSRGRRPCPPNERMRWGWNGSSASFSSVCDHCEGGSRTPIGRRCCGEACSQERCSHLLKQNVR